MKKPQVRFDWLGRAIEVYNYHSQCLQENKNWTIKQTASDLGRSEGGVVEDLMLANWSRTHERELRKFKNLKDAVKWAREMQLKLKTCNL